MSMSATIALSSTKVAVNQKLTATLTISNSGATNVSVTSVQPITNYTGGPQEPVGCALGDVPTGPGYPQIVVASGTLAVPFDVVFFYQSTGVAGGGSGTYDIGALIQTSDGSVFKPTAATATVTNLAGI